MVLKFIDGSLEIWDEHGLIVVVIHKDEFPSMMVEMCKALKDE